MLLLLLAAISDGHGAEHSLLSPPSPPGRIPQSHPPPGPFGAPLFNYDTDFPHPIGAPPKRQRKRKRQITASPHLTHISLPLRAVLGPSAVYVFTHPPSTPPTSYVPGRPFRAVWSVPKHLISLIMHSPPPPSRWAVHLGPSGVLNLPSPNFPHHSQPNLHPLWAVHLEPSAAEPLSTPCFSVPLVPRIVTTLR